MEYSEKKVTVDLDITDILEKYTRLGIIKSIEKLAQPNLYRIIIKGTAAPSTVREIHRHLRKCGYQTMDLPYHRMWGSRYRKSRVFKSRISTDRYIIAKVAAPPEPKNPDGFGRPRPRKASQKKETRNEDR